MIVRVLRDLVCCMVVVTFLFGCSSTYRLYRDSLQLAFQSGPQKSLAEVQQSQVDLMQLTFGDQAPVFLALAYLEDDKYKWVSADHAVFVFHHDKLVKTSGFNNDLLNTSDLSSNLLKLRHAQTPSNWRYSIDVANHGFGLPVVANLQHLGLENKDYFNQSFQLEKWVETIQVDSSEPYWDRTYKWQNTYLVEPKSGLVFFSEQTATPYTEPLVIAYVSRIARYLKNHQGE